MNGLKGSITVFLTLIFTSVLALVCVVLESVRISSAVTKAEGITYMGLDSCFAGYGRELFEEYGVLSLWNTEAEFVNTYRRVTENNCNITTGLKVKGLDIYGLRQKDLTINHIQYLTDNDGELFEKQVYDYMILKLGSNVVDKLLDKTKILSQGQTVSEFYTEITSCDKVFSKAENAVINIKSQIDNIKNIQGNPVQNVSGIIEKKSEILNVDDEQYILTLNEQIRVEYGNYNRWSEQISSTLLGVKDSIDAYRKFAKNAKKQAEKLSKKAEEFGKELDKDIFDVIRLEVKEITDKFDEQDNYGVEACEKETEKLYKYLSEMDISVDNLVNGNIRNLNEMEDLLKRVGNFNLAELSINIAECEIEKVENTIKDNVDNMLKNGLLNLVTDTQENISSKQVDLTGMPSNNGYNNGNCWTKYNLLETSVRKAVFGEYVLSHFGNYTDTKVDNPLNYEVEYIIEGCPNDKENLESVVEKIIAIRGGFNMISIFKDSVKRNETYVMASAVAGVTGMPLVVKIVQIGIVSAWSAAESVADVKNLLKGKRVALIKSPSQWNLSLDSILSVGKVEKKEDDIGGLSYKDYLRYLLSCQNKALQANRTMDVIQLSLSNNYNKDFKMSDCITNISITSSYQVKKLFSQFIPIRKISNMFDFEISQQYEY